MKREKRSSFTKSSCGKYAGVVLSYPIVRIARLTKSEAVGTKKHASIGTILVATKYGHNV